VSASVLCPTCGAKIKKGRPRCLRCRTPLDDVLESQPSQTTDQPASGGFRVPGRWLIAGVIISLAVLVLTVFREEQSSNVEVKPAPNETPVTTGRPQPPARPARPESETATGEPKFMSPNRAGVAAYTQGNFQEALGELQKAIEKNPEDADSLNNMGQVLVRLNRTPEAVPYFERAIQLSRANWAPRFNLGRAYGLLNQWPKAVDAYRDAATVFPDDYATHYNLGLALHKAEQEEAAIGEFQKAIELAPAEPSFRLSLGLSYERMKKPLEAARAYEQYLDLAPTAPDAIQVKARIQTLKNPT